MIARARAKCPSGRFDVADMTNFHLGRCHDGVLCMSGSNAHAVTLPRLREAVQVGTREYTVESGDLRVTRTHCSERGGQRQRVYYHDTIEGPDGTRKADQADECRLFTVDEMLAAFSVVGLAATSR